MFRSALNAFRLLAALALLLASVMGHSIAMAEAPMPGEMFGMLTVVDMSHDHGAPCADDRCGTSGPSCCVMGQCLLSVPGTASFEFQAPVRIVRAPAAVMAHAGVAPILPYRPPASD